MGNIGKSAQAGWPYYLHHTEEPGALMTPSKVSTLVIRKFHLVEIGENTVVGPKIRAIKEEVFNMGKYSEKLTTDVTIHPGLGANYVIDSAYRAMPHITNPIRIPTWTLMPRITVDGALEFTERTAEATRVAHLSATIQGEDKKVYPFGKHGNSEDMRAAVDVATALLSEVRDLPVDRFGPLLEEDVVDKD